MDMYDRWEFATHGGATFLKFSDVEHKRTGRPDLHAFLVLDELFPGTIDLICTAGYDKIWLDIDDDLIESMDDKTIVELSRCGVFYDSDIGSLAMFV